ncbi:hypothetical protein ES708_26861 [subsurface metagenome]
MPDEAATRVYTESSTQQKDAYNLQNTSIPVGATINSVGVYFRVDGGGYPGYGQPFLRLGTNETAGAEQRHQYAWQTYSQILARPGGGSWSRADLNSLQGVIGLRAYSAPKPFHCTQVYVEVDFSPPTAPTVTTQAATNVQATTARLNGQISNDGGLACQYRFRYKKGVGGAYSYTTWTGAKTTGQTFYENISGLDKKSLYYFNAQAKNSVGESAWGGELSFTTLATIPVVSTQAVDDILPTTATGNGSITDDGGGCSKRGVCWNTTGSPTVTDDKSEQTDSFGVGAFTRPMTGLSPATHYYVKAYAYNSVGYGYGGQVEFTTAAIAYKDIAIRFRLRVQAFVDIATRFGLAFQGYSDVATRFKLKPLVYQDVSTRFHLYQPSWKSLQILKDIAELEAQVAGLKPKPRAHFEI